MSSVLTAWLQLRVSRGGYASYGGVRSWNSRSWSLYLSSR